MNRPRQIPKSKEWELGAYRGGKWCVDDRFCTFRLTRETGVTTISLSHYNALSSSTKLSHLNRPVCARELKSGDSCVST